MRALVLDFGVHMRWWCWCYKVIVLSPSCFIFKIFFPSLLYSLLLSVNLVSAVGIKGVIPCCGSMGDSTAVTGELIQMNIY